MMHIELSPHLSRQMNRFFWRDMIRYETIWWDKNIEAYGTGLGKILRTYEGKTEQPTITTTNNSFKIILPNINSRFEIKEAVETRTTTAVETNPETRQATDDTAQQILQYARTHGEITRADVEKLLGISAASASRRIRNLVTSKQLRQIGKARNIRYTVYDA